MNICFIVNDMCSYGGIQRMLSVISNELCKRHEITIIETRFAFKNRNTEPSYQIDPRVHIVTCTSLRMFLSWAMGFLIRKAELLKSEFFRKLWIRFDNPKSFRKFLIEQVNEQKCDIVVAIAVDNTVSLSIISNEIPAKRIAWQRNTYEQYFTAKKAYYKNLEDVFAESLLRMHRCVVLTNDIKQKYERHLKITPTVMYNPRSFVCDKKSNVDEHMFIACGRFVQWKGFDLLLQAFKEFSLQNESWNLTLVGDGPQRGKLESIIHKLGIAERVVLPGYVQNIQDYFLKASVFLMPSRTEGFGNVIVEAFETGLPVIAWDVASPNELVDDGVNGVLVTPFATDEFARQMLRLASNDSERKQMSQSAKKTATQFSLEKIIANWEALFEKTYKTDNTPASKS